jgi:Cu/Ag efflux protein CusF
MHAATGPAVLAHLAHFTAVKCRARVTGVRTILTLLVVACAGTSACSRARHYELRGQILAVDRERQEITISHDDIRGFMPAMTMPFKVKDARLLEGRHAGDLRRRLERVPFVCRTHRARRPDVPTTAAPG